MQHIIPNAVRVQLITYTDPIAKLFSHDVQGASEGSSEGTSDSETEGEGVLSSHASLCKHYFRPQLLLKIAESSLEG